MPAKKKSSPSRAAAARANGNKSRGPKTAAGKTKSASNSLKHGARCSTRTPLLLPGEDPTKLQLYTDAYYHHFCPKDLAEASLVDTMIVQVWKAARILGYESEILTSAAEDLHPKLADEYASINVTRLFALAFHDSAEKGKNPLPLRYLVSIRNMFRSALSDLIRLRQAKGNPEESFIQPPKILPNITNFSIDPETLPVSGLDAVTHESAPPSEPPPFTAKPDPEPQPAERNPQDAFSSAPPQPEPEPVKYQAHSAVPPEPVHPAASESTEAPAQEAQESDISRYPMLPIRDKSTGAIILNITGKPMWIPNKHYIHKPGVTPPLFPFANETFDFGLFPDKHLIAGMLRRGVFQDDALMNEDALPNEPKPPATETRTTASTSQHAHKFRK